MTYDACILPTQSGQDQHRHRHKLVIEFCISRRCAPHGYGRPNLHGGGEVVWDREHRDPFHNNLLVARLPHPMAYAEPKRDICDAKHSDHDTPNAREGDHRGHGLVLPHAWLLAYNLHEWELHNHQPHAPHRGPLWLLMWVLHLARRKIWQTST